MTARAETSDDVAETGNTTPPDGWTRVPLCEIADVVRGVTYKKAQACDVPEDGTLPLLRATNIQDARLVLDADLVHVPSELMSDAQRLREGDIVVATSSGSKHLLSLA